MHRKAVTRLTWKLRESLVLAREARQRQASLDQLMEEHAERGERGMTRRDFLSVTATATAGLALWRPLRISGNRSRIVVVGAGLAGLRFAHTLWTRKGIATNIYEANTRLGGRCWTNRGFFSEGQIAEHGGEFISTEHGSMRRLAAQFGLQLAKVYGGSEPCCNDVCWLDSDYYTIAELNADMRALQPALDQARKAAPYPTLYNRYTPAGYELDHTSCIDWISRNVEGGTTSKLGRILLTNQLAEYGCEPAVQPALNLVYLISGLGTSGLAGTDELYHIVGGNDQIPTFMASQLPQGCIHTGMLLVALKQNSDGTYTCTFEQDSATSTIRADHVILTLPFNQLKKADLTKAAFSQRKLAAINGYALGTNAKLALQFDGRPWAEPDHWSGACYTDPGDFQLSWDATVSQQGPAGILLRYPGGDAGGKNAFTGALPHGPAPARYAREFLSAVEAPFPGCQYAYNGMAWLDWWQQDPFIGGAYGCYQLGNYTAFAGIEAESEGNVHFCGEQTSLNFQGFMEGAVRSAETLAFRSGIF
jgi:monoamine oxidase